jgi:hypothetical protein
MKKAATDLRKPKPKHTLRTSNQCSKPLLALEPATQHGSLAPCLHNTQKERMPDGSHATTGQLFSRQECFVFTFACHFLQRSSRSRTTRKLVRGCWCVARRTHHRQAKCVAQIAFVAQLAFVARRREFLQLESRLATGFQHALISEVDTPLIRQRNQGWKWCCGRRSG